MPTEEYEKTEKPFMDQLAMMGWTVEEGDTDVPYLPGERESFDDVLLRDQVRDALRRINRHDGEPWLGESRLGGALWFFALQVGLRPFYRFISSCAYSTPAARIKWATHQMRALKNPSEPQW